MTGRGVSIHHLHLALSKWVQVLSLLYAGSRRECGQFKSSGGGGGGTLEFENFILQGL